MSEVVSDKAIVVAFSNAGKTYGKTLTTLVSAFKLALDSGLGANDLDVYQHLFYLNGVQSALGLKADRAKLVMIGSKEGGLSPFDFKAPEKMNDKNRTHDEQRVFDALKSAFSTGRKVAGFPMKPIAPRAPRAPVAPTLPVTGKAQPVDAPRIVANVVDALGMVKEILSELRAVANGKALQGDSGMILRDAIKAFAGEYRKAEKAEKEKDAPKVKALPIAA